MVSEKILNIELTLLDSRLLRRTFLLLWAIDMITAALLILVPYASELNPVTVFFYSLFGYPGVAFAACCYAAIVILIGNFLSSPSDVVFVMLLVVLYLFFVLNNVIILLFDWSVLDYFD
jgi:hypothetical protein